METQTHDGRSVTITREMFCRTSDTCPVVTVVEIHHEDGSQVADVYVTTYAREMLRNGWWSQPDARAMRKMVAEVAATQGMAHIHRLPRQESRFRARHIPHFMTSMTVGPSYRYIVGRTN